MNRLYTLLILMNILNQTWAFNWQDLWVTQDHQGQSLMNTGQFSKAQNIFKDPAWRASAAYKAGDYKQAAENYRALNKTTDSYYNEGNSLAHLGQYKKAIAAYNRALTLDKNNQDALTNRNIVEELLKKEELKQDKQEQDKQEQDKQEQDKQEQDKREQDKREQDKQEQDKQEQDKQEQDKQEQDKQEQDKQEQLSSDAQESQEESEKKQAKQQWLKLIPDDPGGLMRQKFLRDYLKKQRT